MRKFLQTLAVLVAVLIMSSIDSITDLIFSNPISAYFALVIMFILWALIVAVFVSVVKRFLAWLEGDR